MLSAANLSGLNFILFLGLFYLIHLGYLSYVGCKILSLATFKHPFTLYTLTTVFYISLTCSWLFIMYLKIEIAFFIPLISILIIGLVLYLSETKFTDHLKTGFAITTLIALGFATVAIPIISE